LLLRSAEAKPWFSDLFIREHLFVHDSSVGAGEHQHKHSSTLGFILDSMTSHGSRDSMT